jgi:prepilin-type N-terminal cleavage/methylation domain-containing protein
MAEETGQQGFTLVELAIVLVIIGLIIGGVLVGQDMIKAAQIRAQITQINQFNTAVGAFRAKYDCLPGDCASIATYFTTATAGDGNGVISDTLNTVAGDTTDFDHPTAEVINVFPHLTLAGFVPGSFVATPGTASTNFPKGKLSQAVLFPGNLGGVNYWFYGLSSTATLAAGTALAPVVAISSYQASQLDGKMDDGAPETGGVQARILSATPVIGDLGTTPNTGGSGKCYDAGTPVAYVVSGSTIDTPQCDMEFRWQD